MDNSESGDDVFFATAEGLVAGDTDGQYDVYDARAPQPGDNPPSVAVPCEGAACQGPPRVPAPLGAPSSATFSGLGNAAPEATVVKPTVEKKTVKKKAKKRRKKKGKSKGQARKSDRGRGR